MILWDFGWDLWRKNRCALRRFGFNMSLIFARSINLNLGGVNGFVSTPGLFPRPHTRGPFALSLSASLIKIIKSSCQMKFWNISFYIFNILLIYFYAPYPILYTIYLFAYLPYLLYLLGIIFRIILQHFCTYQKIFQFIFNALKIVPTFCWQQRVEQIEGIDDCRVPCNLRHILSNRIISLQRFWVKCWDTLFFFLNLL